MRRRTAKKILGRLFRETIQAYRQPGRPIKRIMRSQEALIRLDAKSLSIDLNDCYEVFARKMRSESRYIYDDRLTKVYRA